MRVVSQALLMREKPLSQVEAPEDVQVRALAEQAAQTLSEEDVSDFDGRREEENALAVSRYSRLEQASAVRVVWQLPSIRVKPISQLSTWTVPSSMLQLRAGATQSAHAFAAPEG